jgi:ABC-type transport system substrate-binding protein
MEMEKKNIAIIVLAIALVASGVGNIIFAVAGESIYGGETKTLRLAMVGDIDTIDPVDSWDAPSNDVMNQITEPLVWYDITNQGAPDEAIELVPCLATDWTYNAAGTELTMNLRKGVYFHDGETFDADAAVYSIERLMYFTNSSGDLAEGTSKAFPSSLYYFADGVTPIIKSVEKTGAYQIKITLNDPFGPFVPLLGYTASNIVSPNTPNERYLDLTEDILVGTGPFELEYYRSETECKFSRNRNWWGGNDENGDPIGEIYWDEMVYVIYEDATTSSNAMLGGDVDVGGVIASLIPQAKEDPDIKVTSWGTGMCYFYWGMNCEKFDQQERAAISLALNYTYVTQEIRQGLAVKANTCVPTALPGYDKEVQPPAFDVQKARTIMNSYYGTSLAVTDDTVWTTKATDDPFRTISLFRHEGSHFNELLNAMVADNLAQIGLATEEEIRDWTTFLQWSAPDGRDNLEMWYIGWCPDYLSAFNMMNPLFNPTSDSASHQAWSDDSDVGAEYEATVVKWLGMMEVETDPAVRQDLAEKIQRKLFDGDDAFLPHIPMFYSKLTYVHSAAIKDYAYNSMQNLYLAQTWRAE